MFNEVLGAAAIYRRHANAHGRAQNDFLRSDHERHCNGMKNPSGDDSGILGGAQAVQ
jgi:hypothetical protein